MSEEKRSGRPRGQRVAGLLLLLAATLISGGLLRAAGPEGARAAVTATPMPRLWSAPADSSVQLSALLDREAIQVGGDSRVRVELRIAAAQPTAGVAQRVPTDLVVVLDRSGSMDGRKIEDARAAVRALIEQLGPEDRFALVSYAQQAERAWPLAPATAQARAQWLAFLPSITPAGGTNLAAGLDLALANAEAGRRAGRARRVILLSDGLANQGDTSAEGLRRRAARAVAGEYALSTVGVGHDFDGNLMAALADAGTGNFHYLESTANLAQVFAAEFETAQETAASALEMVIAPPEGVRVLDAAGYPLVHAPDGSVRFRPGSLFAGQERRIWVTLELEAEGPEQQPLGQFALHFREGGESRKLTLAGTPAVARVREDDAFYAGIDLKSFERAEQVNEVGALRREVSNAVTAGREDDALGLLARKRSQLEEQNAKLESDALGGALDEIRALESQVKDHAEGKKPMAPQQLQQLRALGYQLGRPGSRK